LAIDIGGTKIALAVVVDGRVLDRRQIATPRSGRGSDIIAAIGEQADLLEQASVVGVATTGIVDNGQLTALNPSTLPIEDRFPLVEALHARLGRPVLAINDAQAAAWAEYRLGAGRGAERMAFVTVSTGIGAGIVLDGRLQSGPRGLAGHIGHMVSDPSGPVCGCGRTGCVERLASGTAIGLSGSAALGRSVSAPEVFAAAAAGDPGCDRVIQNAARSLARVLCDLVAAVDLERIVLGGGVGLAGGFLHRVEQAMAQEPAIFHRPLALAGLGADAGLVGVAAMVSERSFH
jgi:N-acylmannosamine kinase